MSNPFRSRIDIETQFRSICAPKNTLVQLTDEQTKHISVHSPASFRRACNVSIASTPLKVPIASL
jgi:hypothetical protein